jgi:hypothetical protein
MTEGEPIQELSSDALDRYKAKAKKSSDDLTSQGKYRQANDRTMNVMKATGKQIDKTATNIRKALNRESVDQDLAEAGPFSYGAKKPRKGTERDKIAQANKKYQDSRPVIEPDDQMVGNARVTKDNKSVAETAQGHKIEAHGVRGMDRKTWRKTFKNVDQLNAWAEKYDAEIHGTRDLEQARRGNLSPAMEGVAESFTKEDIITKLKAKLGDYLSDIGQEIRKDPDLINKLAAKPADNQMGPPVKTVTTDDGHEISIHGNEDDGFRISIKNRQTPSQFSNLDEAVMACEMYCARRRQQAVNADYVEEA